MMIAFTAASCAPTPLLSASERTGFFYGDRVSVSWLALSSYEMIMPSP